MNHASSLTWFLVAWPSDDMNRRSQRRIDCKDVDKAYNTSIQDRSSSCKFLSLKLVLVIIICGTFITLLQSPALYENEYVTQSVYEDALFLSKLYCLHLSHMLSHVRTHLRNCTSWMMLIVDDFQGPCVRFLFSFSNFSTNGGVILGRYNTSTISHVICEEITELLSLSILYEEITNVHH